MRSPLLGKFIAMAVVINDSFGRAWRNGVVGVALGAAGLICLLLVLLSLADRPRFALGARPALLALAVTVFPLNTHLAFYSTFWGGLTLLLAALYAGSLLARE